MPEIEPTECERRLAQWLWSTPRLGLGLRALTRQEYYACLVYGGDPGTPDPSKKPNPYFAFFLRKAVAASADRMPPELRVLAALKGWTDEPA